jgi:GTP-dependent dephospho-CoA kinase
MPLNLKDARLLKRPFGTLVAEKDVTRQKISSMLKGIKNVIAVGDATTERLISFGITPQIAVIDGIERRSERDHPLYYYAKEMSCTNPAGTISKEAVNVLQDALETLPPVRVKVHGEEDLLALPLFTMAPQGSAVLYGQPLEGLVVVKITEEKQKQAKDLMDRICSNDNLLDSIEHFNHKQKVSRKQALEDRPPYNNKQYYNKGHNRKSIAYDFRFPQ